MSITPCKYNDCGWCYYEESPHRRGCVGVNECKIFQKEEGV